MSEKSLCTYCENLPGVARPGWGGTHSKCPLCKQPHWIGQNGTTYRLDADAASPRGGTWRWATGVSMAVCVCLVLAILPFALKMIQKPAPQTIADMSPRVETTPRTNSESVSPGPMVQAKTALPPEAARAKQSAVAEPVAVPDTKVIAKAVVEKEKAAVKETAKLTPVIPYPSYIRLTEELEAQLRTVPEVDLDPNYLKKTKAEIATVAKDIVAVNKGQKDAFIAKVMKERKDLAGMPFLMGKDCDISKKEAASLARSSIVIRAALSEAMKYQSKAQTTYQQTDGFGNAVRPLTDLAAARFWAESHKRYPKSDWSAPEFVPALKQMLPVENKDFRLGLVAHLHGIKESQSTDALVNRALFDLDTEVRNLAIQNLRDRPREQYQAALLKGLSYPWQPVVRHAAQAIADLNIKELVPELINLLDEPDPRAPFTLKEKDGKEKTMVRELVRVNHHRNCMLCHAPVSATTREEERELFGLPVGPTPSPKDPLPPGSSVVYYSARSGETLVRADVTYLRQDFSIRQKVKDPGKWPEMQRYDFLVRTRELTAKELAQMPPAHALVEYKQAIVDVLYVLTGRLAPPRAQAWREMLANTDAKATPMTQK